MSTSLTNLRKIIFANQTWYNHPPQMRKKPKPSSAGRLPSREWRSKRTSRAQRASTTRSSCTATSTLSSCCCPRCVVFAAQIGAPCSCATRGAQLLEFVHIKAYVIKGKMPTSQRAIVLQDFRKVEEPAVLIVTHVGITGLNLDSANIVIFAVSRQCTPLMSRLR